MYKIDLWFGTVGQITHIAAFSSYSKILQIFYCTTYIALWRKWWLLWPPARWQRHTCSWQTLGWLLTPGHCGRWAAYPREWGQWQGRAATWRRAWGSPPPHMWGSGPGRASPRAEEVVGWRRMGALAALQHIHRLMTKPSFLESNVRCKYSRTHCTYTVNTE